MLAHKATHEAKVAAEVAAGQKSSFDARCIPSVAYTDPEIAWVGVTETEAKARGIEFGKGMFPWAASGRSLAINRDEGFTKLLFDKETHRIIGGGIVGTNAGDLIAEVGLAIEMGADAADIGLTIHRASDAFGDRGVRGGSLRGHAHGSLHPEAIAARRRRSRRAAQGAAMQLLDERALLRAHELFRLARLVDAGGALGVLCGGLVVGARSALAPPGVARRGPLRSARTRRRRCGAHQPNPASSRQERAGDATAGSRSAWVDLGVIAPRITRRTPARR